MTYHDRIGVFKWLSLVPLLLFGQRKNLDFTFMQTNEIYAFFSFPAGSNINPEKNNKNKKKSCTTTQRQDVPTMEEAPGKRESDQQQGITSSDTAASHLLMRVSHMDAENMEEDAEMVKFTVQKDFEAMRMAEDETMEEGQAPVQKMHTGLTREQREKAVRTPPLPSAWAVQSLLSQPLSAADKEMPAIDETRVDAVGTFVQTPTYVSIY